MRKYAFVKECNDYIRKVMLYNCIEGCYVFLYDTIDDRPCIADFLEDSIETGEDFCFENYHVEKKDWISSNDPINDCQHDLIRSIRINKNCQKKYEELIGDKWVEINP